MLPLNSHLHLFVVSGRHLMTKSTIEVWIIASLCILTIFATTETSQAGTGFQRDISVSSDGKSIVSSRGRVIYCLDSKSLKVTHRVWAKTRVKRLSFNKDGSKIAVLDKTKQLRLLDIANGKFQSVIKPVKCIFFAPAVNLMAASVASKNNVVVLLSMTDGSKKKEIVLPKNFCEIAIALSPDGTKLVVFSYRLKGKEKKIPKDQMPKKFKNELAREEYMQRHDGKHSEMLVYDLQTGKQLIRKELWYTMERTLAFFSGEDVLIMQYRNPCARISPNTGKISLFKSASFFNYGVGWSTNGMTIVTGSLADGYISREGAKPIEFRFKGDDRLPGWPEYFFGFAIAPDGTIFGVTSGQRIARISPTGKILKVRPYF